MVINRILRKYIIPAIFGLLLGGSVGVAIIAGVIWLLGGSWGSTAIIICAVVFVLTLITIPIYNRYAKNKTREEELQEVELLEDK